MIFQGGYSLLTSRGGAEVISWQSLAQNTIDTSRISLGEYL
jgi:hypothetical protein